MNNSNNSNNSIENLSLDGLQILLAEDCVDQGRMFLTFLEQAGAEVTLECNGQSATDAVRRSPTRFDAIVMDFEMPEMDGLQATQKVRELGFGGAIVALTAYGTDELRESWYRAGCDAFLEKPVRNQTLIETVKQYSKTATQIE